MSLTIRYLTNGAKTAYQVINSGTDSIETNYYEKREDIPQSIRHYASEGEPKFIEPDLAYILGAGNYFYPDFPKCGMPDYEGRRCIAESCKYAVPTYHDCPYFKEEKKNNDKMTIEVNVSNLSEDEREQFKALIDKANTPPPKAWWEGTEFDIRLTEEYYTFTSVGNVTSYRNDDSKFDTKAIKFGNACKDKEYMERRAKEIKRSNLIANFAKVVNEGWEANWDDAGEGKYYICYKNIEHKYITSFMVGIRDEGVVYFKSEKLAQRCIDEVILPLERGEL